MSFAGRGIVLTRPRELGTAFAKEIEARGARAIVFPTIEIQPLPAPAVLRNLGVFDFVVFVSPSAVRVAQTMLPPWRRRRARWRSASARSASSIAPASRR